MLEGINKDFDSKINFEEFVHLAAPLLPTKNSEQEIRKIFKLFDEDNTGKLSFKNIKKTAIALDEHLTDKEINGMINEIDFDKDGYIGFEDFYK